MDGCVCRVSGSISEDEAVRLTIAEMRAFAPASMTIWQSDGTQAHPRPVTSQGGRVPPCT